MDEEKKNPTNSKPNPKKLKQANKTNKTLQKTQAKKPKKPKPKPQKMQPINLQKSWKASLSRSKVITYAYISD